MLRSSAFENFEVRHFVLVDYERREVSKICMLELKNVLEVHISWNFHVGKPKKINVQISANILVENMSQHCFFKFQDQPK